MNTNIHDVSRIINVNVQDWIGNCHFIANLILQHNITDGNLDRGHWLGPVHKHSIFNGKPIIPHSWIGLPNGKKYDPTLWTLTNPHFPEIIVSSSNFYDLGGNVLREMMMKPLPTILTHKKDMILTPEQKHSFLELVGTDDLYIEHLFWVANLPLGHLGKHAINIYMALLFNDHGALIPIDNKKIVLS